MALAFVLLASCATGDASTVAAPTSETAVTAASVEAATPADDNPAFSSDSPIEQLIGVPIMDDVAMNKYVLDVIKAGETTTAECMLAEGFEYTPENPTTTATPTSGGTIDREWIEQHGYGIVDSFEASEVDPANPPSRPNAEYRKTLSDAEREAYDIALLGERPPDEGDGEGSDGDFDLDIDGCRGKALEELVELFATLDAVTPTAMTVIDAWDADPRRVEAQQEWARCMNEAGHEATDRLEVREPVYDMLDKWFNSEPFADGGSADDDGGDGGDPPIWMQFVGGDFYGYHPPLTAENQAQIDEIAAFEIRRAVSDFDCYEPIREIELAIQREYEQQLADKIAPEIGAIRNGD